MNVLMVGLGAANRRAVQEVLDLRGDTGIVAEAVTNATAFASQVQVVVIEAASRGTTRACCKLLRSVPGCSDAVILAILENATANEVADLLDDGVDDFFFSSLGMPMLAMRLLVNERTAASRLARRKAEEDRERFFEMSLDMLCIAGMDGYFKRLNPTWTRVLDWTLEELSARPWLDFIHPDDVKTTIEAGGALRQGAAVTTFKNRYRCRNGSYRWFEWRAVPYLEQGMIYAAARDVTAAHEAYEAQARIQKQLVLAAEWHPWVRSRPASRTRSIIRSRTSWRTSTCSKRSCMRTQGSCRIGCCVSRWSCSVT